MLSHVVGTVFEKVIAAEEPASPSAQREISDLAIPDLGSIVPDSTSPISPNSSSLLDEMPGESAIRSVFVCLLLLFSFFFLSVCLQFFHSLS